MHIIVMNAIAAPAPQRGLLDCPACGSQRVVLTHLDCRALGLTSGEVQIGRDGLRIDPAIPDPEGGATVGLRCTCEQGHDTVIRFRQLRDATVVERTVLPILTHSRPAWRPGRTTPLHKALLSTGELESDSWRRGVSCLVVGRWMRTGERRRAGASAESTDSARPPAGVGC